MLLFHMHIRNQSTVRSQIKSRDLMSYSNKVMQIIFCKIFAAVELKEGVFFHPVNYFIGKYVHLADICTLSYQQKESISHIFLCGVIQTYFQFNKLAKYLLLNMI